MKVAKPFNLCIIAMLSNLQSYKLITLSEDQLYCTITNTGKVIAKNIRKEEKNDITLLSKS